LFLKKKKINTYNLCYNSGVYCMFNYDLSINWRYHENNLANYTG
jgi:hypothetical protein